ncbi:hypothetical protein J0A67_04585 [Algoriphagus aestuariicola]|uniref:DUF4274 domain-containing protein n=1 Tax=Algoriphagus aestuariicola TaxID=1852016 RepID=A0ABS3BLF0_9BACT|nr:hypothetical protein [Algoriphagus aestuariicola]MBN7800124.1 hypothetical protein [Algoriphagus aestuariicola]
MREKGLRKEAFKSLDKFLKSSKDWSFDMKIEFVRFLFHYFENVEDADYGPFPQPLNVDLVKPALEEWCSTEQKDHNPFRWYGKYYHSEKHIFKALEVNPADDLARQILLGWWANRINYSIHHLPEFYIGDPIEDIQLEEKIREQIKQLSSPDLRDYWTKEIDEDSELVKNYFDFKNSGHNDFEKWGKENNKQTGYSLTRSYYYEK